VIQLEPGKTRISIRLDHKVIDYFREQVERAGMGNYQTLINDALVALIQQRSMIDTVRQVVREELAAPNTYQQLPHHRPPQGSDQYCFGRTRGEHNLLTVSAFAR